MAEATVKAVVKYAATLRERATKAREADPYVQPYAPSEAVARSLSQRLGPEEALAELRRRALAREADWREGEWRAERARRKHERHRAQFDHQRVVRQRLSVGQRFDRALADLSLLPGISAQRLDADRVRGGRKGSCAPRMVEDPHETWRAVAVGVLQRIEDDLDARQRRVGDAAATVADRDDRLRALAGLRPSQVSMLEPSLGTPRQVRESRLRLGLDEITGVEVSR